MGILETEDAARIFDGHELHAIAEPEIRDSMLAGIADDIELAFDAALADPANPAKLKAEYQSDWLHPNDLGYQKMAETAAKSLGGKQ